MLERLFHLTENGTTVRTELIAGATTFLTMAYIIFVNPLMLADAGMDRGAVFVATCLAAAIGTLIMGLYANYPIALAPGMGLNAYFTYTVVGQMGFAWQVALGAVFLSGMLFLLLSLSPVRDWVVNAVPQTLKLAISAGIGLFLAIIALKNAGVVVAHPATLVTVGDVSEPPVLLAAAGFIAIIALERAGITGAIVIAVLGVTAAGVALRVSPFNGVVSVPPSIAPTFLAARPRRRAAYRPGDGRLRLLLRRSVRQRRHAGRRLPSRRPDGYGAALPRLRQALVAASLAAAAGAVLGTSTTTSYMESAAGIERRRTHRADRGDRRRAVPAGAVFGAARDHGPGLRDRPGAAVRRLPDEPVDRRLRLGRPDRIRAGGRHHDRHAAHLFHRDGNRLRLHQLRRSEAGHRTTRPA